MIWTLEFEIYLEFEDFYIMETREHINDSNETQPIRFKGVRDLLLSIMLILIFMFGIAPLMDRLPFIRPLVDFIEERDIDAGALYYTEIEEFSEAAIQMENTMDYGPREPY